MKNFILPTIAFLGMSINAAAQEKSKTELEGDKYAFRYAYTDAIKSYTETEQLSTEGQRHLAESHYAMGQNVAAEAAYLKLILKNETLISEDYYNYAMALKANGKYDESNKWMDKFYESKPADLRAQDYIANKSNFTALCKDDGKYKVTHLNINTEAEDFGTCYYNEKIVFASSRSNGKMLEKKYNWNDQPFLDIYVSEVDKGQLKEPTAFDNGINGKMHDGPASFSNNSTYLAYSANNKSDKSKDNIIEIQIYFSTLENEKWSDGEAFVLNNQGYSVGHPSLTPDGNTMYFASDMPGGLGGTDIYKITKNEKKEWGKPENLGNKINTEGDELFPFIEEKHGILLFSSNGRFGLGGLDVFIAEVDGASFKQAYNAGFPLNTQYDDFAAIVDNNMSKGYISSNRIGGSGGDDIYSFNINIIKKIKGIAKDINAMAVPSAFITLLNDKGEVLDTVTTKADGAFLFVVETEKSFKLNGKKENYVDGDSVTNTFGNELIVQADVILLTKKEIVAQKIQVGADLGKIVEFNPDRIYFDYDKFNILPQAEVELAKIIALMNEYPEMVVELGSHTDCRGTEAYNQVLSAKRAKASVDYIKKRINTPKQIYGKGYGETKLTNACACEDGTVSTCSEEEHHKNRRTEFIIVKK